MNSVTKEQVAGAIKAIAAVAEAIRELGSVPSGEFYARLLGHMSLETYTAIIARLKGAGLVEEKGHVLTWIGPKIEK